MIVIPWPIYPLLTPTGAISKAKTAGKRVPLLTANVVNNLPAPVYRQAKILWRDAAEKAVWNLPDMFSKVSHQAPAGQRVILFLGLYKATGQRMDPLAIVEGAKPIVDGLVLAGVFLDDDQVMGAYAEAHKAATKDECRLEITWERARA